MSTTRPPPRLGTADLNARILRPLAQWVSETKGDAALRSLASAGGLAVEELDGRSRWVSIQQFESILAHARALCGDDVEFQRACVHRLAESYGAVRFVLWATSVSSVYTVAMKTMHFMTSISTGEILDSTSSSLRARYRSSKPESRLSCLSRQAQFAALPTLWGLPPARIEEESCTAHGDDACVYRLQWMEQRRWLPSLAGVAAFGSAAAALWTPGVPLPYALALPILGGVLGHVYELRRTARENLRVGEEINRALADTLRDDAEARREILELHKRQREWVRVIEEQVGERTQTLNDVIERVKSLQASRVNTLLGFSHDLRNPLTVLRSSAEFLRSQSYLDGDDRDAVEDLLRAVHQMERLLRDLMQVASSDAGLVRVTPQNLEVAPLVDRLRRRLRALAHGRDVRTSVFATREAPDAIETDLLIFDRVVDNLLTNAAKYTERGSIVLEIGGVPGFLTIKVSDTGRGMAPEKIEQIFHPGGSERASRASDSYGVGLSVVVRLLAQIGGRLDVMSKPGAGTTFWAHFPVSLADRAHRSTSEPVREPPSRLVESVVTIRRVENAS